MDDQRLCVADVCEVACQLEFIHYCAADIGVAFDAKAEDAPISVRAKESFSVCVTWVAGKTGVGDPSNAGVLFEPPVVMCRGT